MEFYILKSGICLAIFYGFYKLVLEKESFHVFKRFYLLVSAVLAFVIPLITFKEYIEIIPQEVPLFFPESTITNTVIEVEPINYIPIILWSIYGFGVLLFSFKFLKNLLELVIKIKRNPKFKNHNFINVLLHDLVIPHTFLSYIFLNKQKFEAHQIPKEVLLHEETHAKQKHSLDVLFIEILQILFWFNPFIYFIKRSIKLNHEFLADQAVINNGVTPSTYQQILLAFSSNASEPQLANAINYSSIKKRFTVMKTQTSKQAFWLRSFILLPLLAILIYSFSEKNVVKKPFVVQQNITENVVTETMMKEYRDFINDFESSNRIIYPKYLRAVAIYDLMTEEQRNTVKKYPKDIVSDLSNVEPKTPTESEFNSWKDSNKFAIWIDGNHIKNSELNNYKASDIKYYANSFVHNNARSEKFPQSYQNHLYTQKGFESLVAKRKEMLNGFISKKIEIKKELQNQQKEVGKINPIISISDDNETVVMDKIKYTLDDFEKHIVDLVDGLSTEEKEKFHPIIVWNSPNGKALNETKEKTLVKLKTILREHNLWEETNKNSKPNALPIIFLENDTIVNSNQEKATSMEIEEYNSLVKKFNSLKEGERIIKVKDKNRIEHIYSLMTNEQKKENEAFPDFSTIAPPPKPYQENTPQDIVEEYKKKYNELEVFKNTPPHYVYKTETEQKKMSNLYFDLNNLYIKMSDVNRQLVSRPEHPILPYAQLKRNGKIEYKKISELTEEDKKLLPPPPPPPPKPIMPKNPSKELLEAKKKFEEIGGAYGRATQTAIKEGKGNFTDLKIQYEEVMKFYNAYRNLAEKENATTLPPPPPPPAKK